MWPFGSNRRRASDDSEELRRRRTLLLDGEVTDEVANVLIAKLLFLQHHDSQRLITLRIDSPGGSLTAGMAVVDTIRCLTPPIRTEAPHRAHGIAAVILASGRKEHRVVGAAAGLSLVPLSYVESRPRPADERHARLVLAGVIGELTGQSQEAVAQDLSVGCYLTAEAAIAYGLADRIEHPLAGLS